MSLAWLAVSDSSSVSEGGRKSWDMYSPPAHVPISQTSIVIHMAGISDECEKRLPVRRSLRRRREQRHVTIFEDSQIRHLQGLAWFGY